MYDDTALQILEYHCSMLDDRERTGSFLKAILKAGKPGESTKNALDKARSWNEGNT